jgi:vancomycin resistance protein YoaR
VRIRTWLLLIASVLTGIAMGPRVLAQPTAPPSLETHGTTADLHLPSGIVGRHQTSFDAADAPRAHNVDLAASLIDGATIRPHRTLSFDERVGPRTAARGFLDAETLLNGVPTPGIGGGICQVATTLFVAAFTAGLPVTEVHPHTRLPPYARPGMDAAIASDRFDLRLENPLASTVTIHAHTERGRLIVELASTATPLDVSWDTTIEETSTPRERVERVRGLSASDRRVIDEGATGWTVLRTRVVRQDGHAHRDRAHVRYHAFPRIVRTGRATATARPARSSRR